MKIYPASLVPSIDRYTTETQHILSIDLMERAANAICQALLLRIDRSKRTAIFCGQGNNGGDGLAIARILFEKFSLKSDVYLLRYADHESPDYTANLKRLRSLHGLSITEVHPSSPFPFLEGCYTYGIDAILGTGLRDEPSPWIAEVIRYLNRSSIQEMFAIDIPSGLLSDLHSAHKESIIKASHTFTLGFPKLALLFPENASFVGDFSILDIGLESDLPEPFFSPIHWMNEEMGNGLQKERNKFDHKGTFGHALLLCGRYGMMGAAILSATACLRAGAGKLSVRLPKKGVDVMQIYLPEAMVSIDDGRIQICSLPRDLSAFSSIGIGPSLGCNRRGKIVLKQLLLQKPQRLVIDADAISLLGKYPELLPLLPKECILTPHIKEFERLAGKTSNDFERYELQKEICQRYGIIILLKGAHSCICLPNGESYFNSTGNPAMATAGSGDVLTGIITSLLAQDYAPKEAALYGAYLHGKAGDLAIKNCKGSHLIASDLLPYL